MIWKSSELASGAGVASKSIGSADDFRSNRSLLTIGLLDLPSICHTGQDVWDFVTTRLAQSQKSGGAVQVQTRAMGCLPQTALVELRGMLSFLASTSTRSLRDTVKKHVTRKAKGGLDATEYTCTVHKHFAPIRWIGRGSIAKSVARLLRIFREFICKD